MLESCSEPERHDGWIKPLLCCARFCSLEVSRGALLPRLLTVQETEAVLRKPFKSPHPNAPSKSAVRVEI